MKYLFGATYVLVLATQLPHIWYAYVSLELPSVPLTRWTALGAAIAFELAIGIFTFRIVKGSRRVWTRRGLAFFIVASIVANAYYYGWLPLVFDVLMPVFATLALPLALALFAEEFGVEVKTEQQRRRTAERKAERMEHDGRNGDESFTVSVTGVSERIPNDGAFLCPECKAAFLSQQALAGHMNAHRKEKVR